MVKTSLPKKKKRAGGRPSGDPRDLRTERVAIRLHPDLTAEVNKACRAVGVNRSIFIERLLIEWLYAHSAEIPFTPVDAIGRYISVDEHAGPPRIVPPGAGPASAFWRAPGMTAAQGRALGTYAAGARRAPGGPRMKDPKKGK